MLSVDLPLGQLRFDSIYKEADDPNESSPNNQELTMNILSSLGFRGKKSELNTSDDFSSSEKILRISKKSILQQILLVMGLSTGFVGFNGCTSLSPPPAPAPWPSTSKPDSEPPKISRTQAITERSTEDIIDLEWLRNPISFELKSASRLIGHHWDNLRQVTFSHSPSAKQFAVYDRETDLDGDIELKLYHHREKYEWPSPQSQPPSHDLMRDGRLALGDWMFDHTRDQILRVTDSRRFEASRPRFLWNEQLDVDEDIDLRLSFDLLNKPQEKPMALARMSDSVVQLLAFAGDKATPENRHLRALVRPMWLFLYHVLGRLNAHYAHETAHGFGESLDTEFVGQRKVNGIPGPEVFPQVIFEDKDEILKNHIEGENDEGEPQHQTESESETEPDLHRESRELVLQALINGPNQHTLHNRLIYLRNLQDEDPMSIYDAWAYIIQNNLMPGSAPLGYMLSDRENPNHVSGDINRYVRLLHEKGLDVELDRMIRNKIVTLMSTAESYRAVIAIINEVIGLVNDLTGLNLSRLPDLPRGVKVLGADIHWPLVEHYLARDGEIMNIILPINPNGQYPITFEFSSDLDSTQSNANVNFLRGGLTLGYRHQWFTVEAGGAISAFRNDPSEIRAMTGLGRLTIPVLESGLSIILQLLHQKQINGNDPINEIQGYEDGTNATVILCLDW